MTASFGPRRAALAAAFVAILLGVLYASNELLHPLALLAAFGIVIAVIGAAVIGWEHVVANAESAGLVERSD
jgi:hypothetical protein